jgi:hypothetical protein
MKGNLDLYCFDCGQCVEWRKVMIYRQDAYTDWRLSVGCGCGETTDERILARAREAYDLAIGAELETMHRNLFEAALGRSGNLYFETLTGMGPGRMRLDPCRFSGGDREPAPQTVPADTGRPASPGRT